MNSLHSLARRLRHSSLLKNATGLWALARPLYHWLLDPTGRGVAIQLGDRSVRLPAAVLGTHPNWSDYETQTFIQLSAWLEAHPKRPTVLDVGCSMGVLSSFVLQTCPTAHVIAIDSDIISLRAMEAVVPKSAHSRLQRIQGLLGTETSNAPDLDDAIRHTQMALPKLSPTAAIPQSTFVCLKDQPPENIPRYSLDSLFSAQAFSGPLLLKIDVEGAEALVLCGAHKLLQRFHPTLLLSVHPRLLADYGSCRQNIANWLEAQGYEWHCFDQDHEEHWLAEFRK